VADKPLGAELDRLGFPPSDRIENPQPERGMFSSILCAANWDGWKTGLNVWAIVLGDQPHLRLGLLRTLLAFHREHPNAICQPAYDGHAKHPVLLPRRAFKELKLSPAETLKDFLKQTAIRNARCPVEDPGLALDLDTPEDYRRAQNCSIVG
jgi:molybdenum cofactor cytidylyltransferase